MTDRLRTGTIRLTGRLVQSSNGALLADIVDARGAVTVVYKPVAAERPLWDFPDGTLAGRESAASLVSDAAGWHCVPPTILRDGPAGPGMVQQWITDADPDLAADLLDPRELPDDWIPILRAADQDGHPLVLAHADTEALAVLAAFDVLVNNADRKASHILATPDGRIRGVDHGLTFHAEPKLRTILWGFAGRRLPTAAISGLRRIDAGWDAGLRARLATLISGNECDALRARLDALLADPTFPPPPDDRTPIPWPPL